jgi:S-methylmethionine-dependent homocysteine/selenocysteine methylase
MFTDKNIDPLLKRLRTAKFWHVQSAEALCRTSIDLVLFERLSAHQEDEALRNLVLQAEKPIVSYLPNPKEAITGDVDYQLGYWTQDGRALESAMIVVEAKKHTTLDSGVAQCAAYLGMFTAVDKF